MGSIKNFCLTFIVLFCSCRTNQYLLENVSISKNEIQSIDIVSNSESRIIPVAVYPSYQEVENYVKKIGPINHDIDSIILQELKDRGLDGSIIEETEFQRSDSFYLKYLDYWAWDFKKYMHVLRITLYNSNDIEISTVISQGDTGGMHNYPTPKKQIPGLMKLLLDGN